VQDGTGVVAQHRAVADAQDRLLAHEHAAARQVVGAAVDRGTSALEERGVLVRERDLLRVRDRSVLRYYARTIQHLLNPPKRPSRTP
jgi:hypothetical protein